MEISFKLSSEEFELAKDFANKKCISLEMFIREAIIDYIEWDISKLQGMIVDARESLERDRLNGSVQISPDHDI